MNYARLGDLIALDESVPAHLEGMGIERSRARRLCSGEETITPEIAPIIEDLILAHPEIGRIPGLHREVFIRRYTTYVQSLDELAQFALLIGISTIAFDPQIGFYSAHAEDDDPNAVWCGGMTSADTRLIAGEMRRMSRTIIAAAEDDGGDALEAGPDPHRILEFLAAAHALVAILAQVAYRQAEEEAESAYAIYADSRDAPEAPMT
ncbi:hypothetical protein THIOKS13330065 [Thiocapsa sp. KS1]|nr:hypothetical protein [Thiocapsa sp. KS1]CRI67059.1 hypothetical protein THIOKS13330065 [Thiocapsa sp. KS1]